MSVALPRTQVIVATYNRPDHLERCLLGLRHQSDRSFDVAIADDGSGEGTRSVIARFQREGDLSLTHYWQPDTGYHKSEILNRTLAGSDAELVVFLDHDAVAFPDLIATYRRTWRPRQFSPGGWVFLPKERSDRIDAQRIAEGRLAELLEPADRRALRLRMAKWRTYRIVRRGKMPRLVGLNFAVSRDLLVGVNGFDEDYPGWGGEDTDLRTRMVRAGGRVLPLWTKALALHLWHPDDPTKVERLRNRDRYRRLKRGELPAVCERGLAERIRADASGAGEDVRVTTCRDASPAA